MNESEIVQAIVSLREELQVTREVLDEIREELAWANHNAGDLPDGGAIKLFRQAQDNDESAAGDQPATNQRQLF